MANGPHGRMIGAIILLVSVVATACGGGDSTAPVTQNTGAAGTTTEEAPATAPTDAPGTEDQAEPTDAPVTEEEAEPTDAAGGAGSTDPLHLGYILPETGQLAHLGVSTIAAVNVAVNEINEAGGVLGNDVQLSTGDEGDSDGVIANQSADRLLESQNVDAIIGTLSTAVMLTVIDKITGSGTVECAPAGTSPVFTDYPDDGYHFRAAASDLLLGPVFANVMAGDGHVRIAYISRSDDAGRNLVEVTQQNIEEVGAENVAEVFYDPGSRSFDAEVGELAAAQPDAIFVYAFDEGSTLLQTMIEGGVGPDDVALYAHSGLRSAELPAAVDPGDPTVLDGVKGLSPAASQDQDLIERLEAEGGELPATLFAAEAYDCTIVTALAAEQAGSTDSQAIRDEMIAVTREGTQCSGFEECRDLIADGEDIDYEGESGPVDFTEVGEPSVGTYDVWGWNDGGTLETIDTIRTDQLG